MKCDCCGIWDAKIEDMREQYDCINNYYVCGHCFNLDDGSFFNLASETDQEEKNDLLRSYLDEQYWPKWGLIQ